MSGKEQGDPMRVLAAAYACLHPEEVARQIEWGGSAASELLERMPVSTAALVVSEIVPAAAARLLDRLRPAACAAIVGAMTLGAAAAVSHRLDAGNRASMLEALESSRARALRQLLAHRPGTAGALMDPTVPALDGSTEVAEAIERLRSEPHVGDYLYVIGAGQTLSGAVALSRLLTSASNRTLSGLARTDPPSVPPSAGLQAIADHPAWRTERALAVVDSAGRLLGAISYETVRRIEGELGRVTREAPAGITASALAELYGVGVGAMLKWVIAPVLPPRSSRSV